VSNFCKGNTSGQSQLLAFISLTERFISHGVALEFGGSLEKNVIILLHFIDEKLKAVEIKQ